MKYYLHLETNRWDSRGCAIERQSMRVACFQGELWTALTVRNMLDDPSLWAADRAVHYRVRDERGQHVGLSDLALLVMGTDAFEAALAEIAIPF